MQENFFVGRFEKRNVKTFFEENFVVIWNKLLLKLYFINY